LVGCARDLVRRILDGVLGIAQRLLALALDLLDRAFALQAVGTGRLADALLGLAHGLVGRAFNLVCRASHGTLLLEGETSRDKSGTDQMFLGRLSCDARYGIFRSRW